MSGYCPGCGRADMAGITHACPPPESRRHHHCKPPIHHGITAPLQPDWTCGACGRVWRDCRESDGFQWWAEIRGPAA